MLGDVSALTTALNHHSLHTLTTWEIDLTCAAQPFQWTGLVGRICNTAIYSYFSGQVWWVGLVILPYTAISVDRFGG